MHETPDEIRALLASGDAERRVIFIDEAYYANSTARESRAVYQWSLGIDPGPDNGTYGEWAINWYHLGGQLCWRLDVFGDGFAAFDASDLAHLLADHVDSTPGELRTALAGDGWIDRTPRTDPYAR